MLKTITLGLLLFLGSISFADTTQPTLLRLNGNYRPFSTVIPGRIYRGAHPQGEADYEFLKSHGVKTILNLGVYPWEVGPEVQNAQRFDLNLEYIWILPGPIRPEENSVERALAVLRDSSLEPIYVHCRYGRDRTSLLIGIYSWSAGRRPLWETWEEMKYYGFNKQFLLIGLFNYFRDFVERHVPSSQIDQAQEILNNDTFCGGIPQDQITSADQCIQAARRHRPRNFHSPEYVD
jgi:protein tyrosine/serine phosphatase